MKQIKSHSGFRVLHQMPAACNYSRFDRAIFVGGDRIRSAIWPMGPVVLMRSHLNALNARVLSSSIRAQVARPIMVWYHFDSALAIGCNTGLHIVGNRQARVDILWRLVWSQSYWTSHNSEIPRVHLWQRYCHALSKSLFWHNLFKKLKISGRNNERNRSRTWSRLSR